MAIRTSVVLALAGVVTAATAAGYYFFFVFAEQDRVRAAQAQVEEWESSWALAYPCLVGESPLAADLGDALLARGLLETKEAVECARNIGKLSRPPGNSSAIAEAEAAWESLEQSSRVLAQGYVGYRRSPENTQALGAALERVVDARRQLRRAVRLPAAEPPRGPALGELVATPLTLVGAPLTELSGRSLGGVFRGRAAIGAQWLAAEVELRQGAPAVTAVPARPEVMRAAPNAPWGAASMFAAKGDSSAMQLLAGPLGRDGNLVGPKTLTSGASLLVGAALDAPAARAVLYVGEHGLRAALSRDGGATWSDAAVTANHGNVFPHGDGTVDLVWQEQAGAKPTRAAKPTRTAEADAPPDGEPEGKPDDAHAVVRWQRVRAAALPALGEVRDLAGVALLQACAAQQAPWALVRRDDRVSLVRLDQAQAQPELALIPEISTVLACDDEGALLSTEAGHVRMSCTRAGCRPLLVPPDEALAAVVAGAPLLVRQRGTLIAVYRGEQPAQLRRLSADSKPYSLLVLGATAFLVLQRGDGALATAPL
jgi:hypothetical protein